MDTNKTLIFYSSSTDIDDSDFKFDLLYTLFNDFHSCCDGRLESGKNLIEGEDHFYNFLLCLFQFYVDFERNIIIFHIQLNLNKKSTFCWCP